LDADRINTIDFESPKSASFRTILEEVNWVHLVEKYESYIEKFRADTELNIARTEISSSCRDAAKSDERLFWLRIPTGGGKTLASLRFALHRAIDSNTHKVDRIIYVVPYTSILDQNAKEVAEILGKDNVLEHHSNLMLEEDSSEDTEDTEESNWRNKVLSENWDSPIVFTTMVQFLNSLYAGGTKTARRMHQLFNAVIVFDEVQALPIKTLHLFNNSLNFLHAQESTTSVLCTATMPLLHKLNDSYGSLSENNIKEIVPNIEKYHASFQRTIVHDYVKPEGWSFQGISELGLELQNKHKSLLVVCNMKRSVQTLFSLFKENKGAKVVLLSTDMCPAHRKERIDEIREVLENNEPLICVSSQLIEAGVDLDFGCVIRSLAGLDSIVQAAGRCNRHGKRGSGDVYVLNFSEEKLDDELEEIKEAQNVTRNRVLTEHKGEDLLAVEPLETFYKYYYYQRRNLMTYPVGDTNLIDLLSENSHGKEAVKEKLESKTLKEISSLRLHHAYTTSCNAFRVIDAPSVGVIVPYKSNHHDASDLIGRLCASYTNDETPLKQQIKLFKKAQQYSVNLFPNKFDELLKKKAIREIQDGEGIYYLDERYYDDDLGILSEPTSKMTTLNL